MESILGRDFKYPETLGETRLPRAGPSHLLLPDEGLSCDGKEDRPWMNDGTTAVLLQRENPHKASDSLQHGRAAGPCRCSRIPGSGRDRPEAVQGQPISDWDGERSLEALSFEPERLIFHNPLSPKQVFNIRASFRGACHRPLQPHSGDLRLPRLHARGQAAGGAGQAELRRSPHSRCPLPKQALRAAGISGLRRL